MKKEKNHVKIVILAKSKLNAIKNLISKALRDSYISQEELISKNKVLREYNDTKRRN